MKRWQALLKGDWHPNRMGAAERMRRIRTFVRRQVSDIRRGGWPVLLWKGRMVLEVILAVPLVFLARLVRPVVAIRFGGLPCEGIGTLAGDMEVYLCERDAGLHGRWAYDVFCCSLPVCNQQLKMMWERVVHVSRFARSLERLNRWVPGGQGNRMLWRKHQHRDIHNLLARTKPHLSFTAEEEQRGFALLRQLGVPDGAPFVCFHDRDSAYDAAWFREGTRKEGARKLVNNRHRNADIRTYLPAVQELVRRGYLAIRMGAVVESSLPISDPRIIDYAATARTDFLDIFLCAHCRFYLGTGSGLVIVPMIFRRPTIMTNELPLEHLSSWNPYDLLLPKLYWLRSERRFLTFREVIKSGVGRFLRAEQYEQQGLELINNTSEEILAVAIEMDERLKGTWQTTEEDEALQRQFWALFQSSPYHGVIRSRIGAEFLRQHRALLDEDGRRALSTTSRHGEVSQYA